MLKLITSIVRNYTTLAVLKGTRKAELLSLHMYLKAKQRRIDMVNAEAMRQWWADDNQIIADMEAHFKDACPY